jgi:hypothetical protein
MSTNKFAIAVWGTFFATLALCPAAPDEELLGKSRGYPIGQPATWFYDENVRVGSFSHLEQILDRRLAPPPPSITNSTDAV